MFFILHTSLPENGIIGTTEDILNILTIVFHRCELVVVRRISAFSEHNSILFFFGRFVFIARATPVAYGGSQAKGLMVGAVAASLHCSSQQRWILNPLSEAKDRTHNLMVPS